MGVSSAVSDESVAGDSGVYEPSERRYQELLSLDNQKYFKYCLNNIMFVIIHFQWLTPGACLLSPLGRASQLTSWALMRTGWPRAALRCSSASVMRPETSVSPSTSCSCPTVAPSVCRLTRKCTCKCLFEEALAVRERVSRCLLFSRAGHVCILLRLFVYDVYLCAYIET